MYRGNISGEDPSLSVPGPYPAPVVEPSLFGGNQVSLLLGLTIPVLGPDRYIHLEVGKPIYQSLNGPQTSEDYRFGVSFSAGF
jgi:hypothetical protein